MFAFTKVRNNARSWSKGASGVTGSMNKVVGNLKSSIPPKEGIPTPMGEMSSSQMSARQALSAMK